MSKKRIILTRNSGFCFGVKRALDIAGKALKKKRRIYSLGPIIHNPQVVRDFAEKGLKIIKDMKKITSRKAALLIPSHGISPEVLKKKNFSYIDTTCPLVKRVQETVKSLKERGYFVIIAGDRHHPEVRALSAIAGKNSKVLKNKREAKRLNLKFKKVALISQTTASAASFKEILSAMAKKRLSGLVNFNTVCKNTVARQKEAVSLASQVEAMIVIGGKQSANTSRLAKVCKKVNRNTRHVESARDLSAKFLRNKKTIGIATGASTPPYAINEVIKKIRRIDR